MAQVPDVAVAAIDIFRRLLDGDVMRSGICNGFFPRNYIPFAPWRDDLQFGCERFSGQFKAHLIVAFSGAAVRHCIGA